MIWDCLFLYDNFVLWMYGVLCWGELFVFLSCWYFRVVDWFSVRFNGCLFYVGLGIFFISWLGSCIMKYIVCNSFWFGMFKCLFIFCLGKIMYLLL